MGLLSNLFGRGGEKTYRWKPLRCMPGDIVDLMRECERIDAPIVSLEVEYDGTTPFSPMPPWAGGASRTFPSPCRSFATSRSATRAATSSSPSASCKTKGTGSFVSFEIVCRQMRPSI